MNTDQIEQRLTTGLAACGLADCARASEAVAQLMEYGRLLVAANQQLNLTRVGTLEEMASRHFLDAACAWGFLDRCDLARGRVIDVGSGAGVPGLVWAILRGFERVVCCETTRKKASFIRDVARKLNLEKVAVENVRAEDLGRSASRERFDVVTARALAPLNVLMELTAPLARVDGVLLFPKGRAVDDEIALAENARETLGLELIERERYEIDGDAHGGELLLYRKRSSTPDRYPRRAGIPAKRPL